MFTTALKERAFEVFMALGSRNFHPDTIKVAREANIASLRKIRPAIAKCTKDGKEIKLRF